MLRRTSVVLASAAAMVLISGPALADSGTDPSRQHLTRVSGNKGKSHSHRHRAGNFALKGVRLIEKGGDRPCRVGAIYDRLDPDELYLDNHDFPAVRCGKKKDSVKLVRYHGRDEFVRGLKVCLNGKRNRIKGVEIRGVRLRKGKLVPMKKTHKVRRTNCRAWGSWAACRDDEVAVGMKAYYDKSDGYRGIKLICRPLQQRDRTR